MFVFLYFYVLVGLLLSKRKDTIFCSELGNLKKTGYCHGTKRPRCWNEYYQFCCSCLDSWWSKDRKQLISVADQDPHGSDLFLGSPTRIHIRMKTQIRNRIKVKIQVLWLWQCIGVESQKLMRGGSVDQWSQIRITWIRSRIRIRIIVKKARIRIRIKVTSRIRIWIRNCIRLIRRVGIRIRISVMRIRNTAIKFGENV